MTTTYTWQALLTAVFLALLPVLRAYIQTKLTAPRLYHITELAKVAVAAAEKLGVDAGAAGPAKLNYASEVVVAGAKRLGIKLTQDEVLAFVHAALREMQQVDAVRFAVVPTV